MSLILTHLCKIVYNLPKFTNVFYKVILVMVLVFEEKEKAVKLLVNPKKQVSKAMQVGKHCDSTVCFFVYSGDGQTFEERCCKFVVQP